ncbi:MAG: 5-amino-6-(D-ribitylamino)uracil--L-tyrosine 4-hydroxyphenyl transferase CofH [Proteobacteria bacterium]|nr:5-amino-6-(D-ribitylamino)uracil--L-tyrosine 4-hydroxyphenyl transferase CofH [Pseudomonadota bacterium]
MSPEVETLLARTDDLPALMREAAALRDAVFGDRVTFSKKVFIPLTHLCRDNCGYCTFARPPRRGEAAYLSPEQVLEIARAGQAAGCAEALFTLGDKPELKWKPAAEALAAMGYATTLEYLAAMADLVFKETGLLPHLNPGLMDEDDLARLRRVSVSMGIMLESTTPRLCERGGPHYGAPDKEPRARLATIRAAGKAKVPFTSGILIGIGETRAERIEALLELRDLHRLHGHLQEIIVQNFKAKPDTRMAGAPEPSFDELLWTVAVARLIFGGTLSIQAPPNLQEPGYGRLIDAGIDDWGGVSPVTPDHVNPERPWPALDALAVESARHGKALVERLAVYPRYVHDKAWVDPALRPRVLAMSEADGLRRDHDWRPGLVMALPEADVRTLSLPAVQPSTSLAPSIDRAMRGGDLHEDEIVRLFAARGGDFAAVAKAADTLRRETVGDTISYAVVRNINYTNICYFRCGFCAFSKGKLAANLRGAPYDLTVQEIVRRAREAWDRGATEVCMQGGIHPDYSGEYYLEVCRAVRDAVPGMHVHAFSPLEVWHGATTRNRSIPDFLAELRDAGLGSLPGTAAEVLDDEVRDILCPDKVSTQQWLDIMRAAHKAGLRSTATIMFGHVDQPIHWARHLLRLRDLQKETGGFTELVPLPFVAAEAPIALKGQARLGPTFREAVLMHSIGRLALHPHIPNIQTSWVKMGIEGARHCLNAGANDLGGTLMNESITRAAGAEHGEELPPDAMERLIADLGRTPRIRTTLYADAGTERHDAAHAAQPLEPITLEIATRWTGPMTEQDKRRNLPRPRA